MIVTRNYVLKEMSAPLLPLSGDACTTRPDALFEIICRRRSDPRSNSVVARKLGMSGGPTTLILDHGALPTDRQLQLLAHEYGVPLAFDLMPGAIGTADFYEGLDRTILCKDGAELRDMPAKGRKQVRTKKTSQSTSQVKQAPRDAPQAEKDTTTTAVPVKSTPSVTNPAQNCGSDAEIVDAVVRMLQRGASADKDLANLRLELDAALAEADAQRLRADAAERQLNEVQGLMTRIRVAATMPAHADNDHGQIRMAG